MTSCSHFIVVVYLLIIQQHTLCGQSFVTHCYNVGSYQHCLSTNDTQLTWQAAKDACRARNAALFTVTSLETQLVLKQFRVDVTTDNPSFAFGTAGTWINVSTAAIDDFHWINGSTGLIQVDGQATDDLKFSAIALKITNGRIDNTTVAYRAYTWNNNSYYICQFSSGVDCTGWFQRNSACYKKYETEAVTWFAASDRCLSMNGSLATFNDLNTPNDDVKLRSWLNLTETQKYWVGLVRRWYTTTVEDGSTIDVQYTNWDYYSPLGTNGTTRCVLVTTELTWSERFDCSTRLERFACQTITLILNSSSPKTTISTTTPITTTTTTKSTATTTSGTGIFSTSFTGMYATTTSATQTKSGITTTNKVIPLAVGIGVGVGVPAIIIIVVVVVVICVRHKNRDGDDSTKITAVKKKQNSAKWTKSPEINAYETPPNGDFEHYESPSPIEPSDEDRIIYAKPVITNSKQPEPEVRDGVVYAELEQVT